MLIRHRKARIRLLQTLDGILFGGSLCFAYWLRHAFPLWNLHELEPFPDYLALIPLAMILGPVLLASQGFYQHPRFAPRLKVLGALIRGCTFTVVGVILFLFLLRLQYARSVVIMTGVFAGGLIAARAELTRRLDASRRAQDQLRRHVLWVGIPRPPNSCAQVWPRMNASCWKQWQTLIREQARRPIWSRCCIGIR